MDRHGCPPGFRRKVLDLVAAGKSVIVVTRDLDADTGRDTGSGPPDGWRANQ